MMSSGGIHRLIVVAALCAVASCGGGGGSSTLPAPPMTVRVPTDAPTIAAAIAAAPVGYTVLLEDGVYLGPQNTGLNFNGKPLKLRSRNGAGAVVVDCRGQGPLITFDHGEDVRSEVTGLTVRNCAVDFTGAIYVLNGAALISSNVFENTPGGSVAMGPQIFGFSGSPVIERNMFRDTDCDDQSLSGVVSFVNESFPYIANNVFVGNRCRAVNMVLPDSRAAPVVVNNTLVANRAGMRVTRNVSTLEHWYGNNLIVANERGVDADTERLPQAGDFATVFQNNLVFGNVLDYVGTADLTGQKGNLKADPLLIASPADLRLSPNSPAKNTGGMAHAPAIDFDGQPRVGAIDIGAFEVQ
jgi:hypothetical protein